MDDKKLQEKLDNILFEIRWLQRNMEPPVNYMAIAIVSIIASVITVTVVLHL